MEANKEKLKGLDQLLNDAKFDFLSKFTNMNGEESAYSNLNINCQYFTEDEFLDKHSQNRAMSFLSLNCQGLNSKFSAIKEFTHKLRSKKFEFDLLFFKKFIKLKIHHSLTSHMNQDIDLIHRSLYLVDNVKCNSNNPLLYSWYFSTT